MMLARSQHYGVGQHALALRAAVLFAIVLRDIVFVIFLGTHEGGPTGFGFFNVFRLIGIYKKRADF
jgi:hypothetical protein